MGFDGGEIKRINDRNEQVRIYRPKIGYWNTSKIIVCSTFGLFFVLTVIYGLGQKNPSIKEVNFSQIQQESPEKHTVAPKQPGWLPAATNIWKGIKIYSGRDQNKIYVGQIIDFSENYTIPQTGEKIRAVKLIMNDGSIEWKDRGYIMMNTFVKKEDLP